MTTELELRKTLESHGYTLHKITHFKKHDRIIFGNKNIRIVMNLRSKTSQIALDTLVKACIGSDFGKVKK
jgi:hypothetical protein